jgi:hypothetical protein
MWCHYCDKKKYEKRIPKQLPSSNSREGLALKPKMDPERIFGLPCYFRRNKFIQNEIEA